MVRAVARARVLGPRRERVKHCRSKIQGQHRARGATPLPRKKPIEKKKQLENKKNPPLRKRRVLQKFLSVEKRKEAVGEVNSLFKNITKKFEIEKNTLNSEEKEHKIFYLIEQLKILEMILDN